MATLAEYEAGIENGDYNEIPDAFIEFLGECCLKPLSGDDDLIEFPGECCSKPLADEDPRRGPAGPLRGPADIDTNNTATEDNALHRLVVKMSSCQSERGVSKKWLIPEVSA